jgi:cation transport ATPase
MLDPISRCRRMIFDKTGTLTYGKCALTDIMCAPRDSLPRRRFV